MNVLLSPSTSTRPSLPLPPRHDNSRPSDEETDTDDEATESERDTDAGATESEHESHQSRVRRASESRLDTVGSSRNHTRGPICGIFESKSGKVIDILQAALDGEDSGVEDDGDLNSFKKWLLLLKNDKIFQDKVRDFNPYGVDRKGRRVFKFRIPEIDFPNWLDGHQRRIRTNFARHRGHLLANGSESTELLCECYGAQTIHHNRTKGGKTQKARATKGSKKSNCSARFYTLLEPPNGPNGPNVVRWIDVSYRFMHNHPVGLERPLDTCALSKAARDRIKAALEQGQTIKDVLLRSKEEADKRVEEMRRNNEPIVLCRDDVIAYNDVYNLWYTMTTRRGDQDEAAQLDRLTIQHHQSDGMNQLDAVGPTVNSDTDNTEANIPEPDTVESEAAEAIRHLEELIAAIRSDPRNYCLYRDDITSIIDKQKRQQGKRPWQQSLHVSAKRFRNNQESEERQANADDGK